MKSVVRRQSGPRVKTRLAGGGWWRGLRRAAGSKHSVNKLSFVSVPIIHVQKRGVNNFRVQVGSLAPNRIRKPAGNRFGHHYVYHAAAFVFGVVCRIHNILDV